MGPRVKVGIEIDQLIGNLDLAPTWAELAGVTPPNWVDGISIMPLISIDREVPTSWRKDILIEHWGAESEVAAENALKVRQPTITGLRSKNFKYVEYLDGTAEFYDLSRDPEELENKFGSSTYAQQIQKHKRRLKRLKDCSGSNCQ